MYLTMHSTSRIDQPILAGLKLGYSSDPSCLRLKLQGLCKTRWIDRGTERKREESEVEGNEPEHAGRGT